MDGKLSNRGIRSGGDMGGNASLIVALRGVEQRSPPVGTGRYASERQRWSCLGRNGSGRADAPPGLRIVGLIARGCHLRAVRWMDGKSSGERCEQE